MSGVIHFLNTGHSDCIIVESNGHYGMIDAAEDTDFPANKPWLNLKGYEDDVIDYIFKNIADENGIVTLDFVVATHCHSDHIGGFDTVINHPSVVVKEAFLKPYHNETTFIMERKSWDNVEVYEQMRNALIAKNVPIHEEFEGHTFMHGDLKITLLNGNYRKRWAKFGENISSVVTLVEAGKTRALLVGDLNYRNGDEKIIANQVGKVDLLKVGHHGYVGSTSSYFAKKLSPDYAVITNTIKAVYPDVKYKLKNLAHAEILTTVESNGVKAILNDDGKIEFEKNIM